MDCLRRWSRIAAKLPGRTDNEIKNVWHTHLKKRLCTTISDLNRSKDSSTGSSSSGSCVSYGDVNRKSAGIVEGDGNKGELLSPCNSNISTTNVQSLIGGVEEEAEPVKVSEGEIINNENPSDNDIEFWNWFESLSKPIPPTDEQEVEESESQKMMVGEEGGEEYKNWLKNLENELGLADFGGEDSENDDSKFRSEMWPSLPPSHAPHGFGI